MNFMCDLKFKEMTGLRYKQNHDFCCLYHCKQLAFFAGYTWNCYCTKGYDSIC